MIKIGVIGFGGGSAVIPVMEKELVTPRGGLTAELFVQDTVIANITPGALPVKIAALSGLQLGGSGVAALSALFVALPGTAATVGLLAAFDALGPTAVRVIEYASLGITAFIIYLLAQYVVKAIRSGGRHRRVVYIVIAAAAYLATGAGDTIGLISGITGVESGLRVPQLSALGLILIAIAGIAAYSIYERARHRPQSPLVAHERPRNLGRILLSVGLFVVLTGSSVLVAELLTPTKGGAFLGLIAFSTLSSFGGGEAYVGVADGFFVASGMIGPAEFYGQIVPIANALPGPILVKVAAGIGYALGLNSGGPLLGLLLSSAAYLASVGACCAVALAVLGGYDKARHSLFVRNVSNFIIPVICGLLASTAVAMLHSSARIGSDAGAPGLVTLVASILVAISVAVLHRFVRIPDVLVLAGCGLLSLSALMVI
jgi:chromate transporter